MPRKEKTTVKANKRTARAPAKRGRKPVWESKVREALPTIAEMASRGAPDREIIQHLKISQPTFYKLKKEKKELLECLTRAREIACSDVDAAMYRAALGYEHEEVVEELSISENPNGTKTRHQRRRRTTRYFAPDTKAAALWKSHYDPDFTPPNKERPNNEISEEQDVLFWIFDSISTVCGSRLPAEQERAYEEKMQALGLAPKASGNGKKSERSEI